MTTHLVLSPAEAAILRRALTAFASPRHAAIAEASPLTSQTDLFRWDAERTVADQILARLP